MEGPAPPRLRTTPLRDRVLRAIEECQGITKAEICRKSGLSWGTVSHHVRQLTRAGAIRFQATDRRIYLFGADVASSQMTLMRLMRDETTQRILDHVRVHPRTGIQDLSRALRLSRHTVRRYMSDLVDAHVLLRTDDYRPKFSVSEAPLGPSARLEDPAGARRPGLSQ